MTARIDRDGLHVVLWSRRTRQDTLSIDQVELADELAVTKHTVNRILREFEDQGRIRAITTTKGAAVKTYEVLDPRQWIRIG